MTHSAVSQLLRRQDDGPALLPGYSPVETHGAGVTYTPSLALFFFFLRLHFSLALTQFEGFYRDPPCKERRCLPRIAVRGRAAPSHPSRWRSRA